MFNKGKLHRVLALLLAALMLCLGGCADEGPADPSATGDPGATTGPTESQPTPLELLSSALDVTRADLEARFGASPLAGLTGLAPDGVISANLDIAFPDELGELAGSLAGDAVYNARTGEARADLVISTDGMPLELYYSPEFMGISCDKVFGNKTFYGLRPYALTEQLSGSALQELIKLDMDAVAQLDAILDSVPRDVNVFKAPEVDQLFRACHELIGKLELTAEATALTRGGAELKGTAFKAVISADALADFVKKLSTAVPDWVLIYGMGTGDDSAAAVNEAVEAIRSRGVDTPVTFTVADGKLYHIKAEYKTDGETVYVEAELYGDNGSTVSLTVEPELRFVLDLSAGASMELKVADGSTTSFNWAPDGEFSFITYRGDVTDLCLEGTLKAGSGSVSFEGIWYSGERGDRNPLRFTTTPGGQIEAPETTQNVTELGTRELYFALMKIVFNLF